MPYRPIEVEEILKGESITNDLVEKAAEISVREAIPLKKITLGGKPVGKGRAWPPRP